MVRRLFLTPPNLPEETALRCVTLPDDKNWWGLLNAALLLLTQEWQYEQVHETDLTPAECAAYFQVVYNNYLLGACGVRDVRQNVIDPCTLEKTLDGETWLPWANILACAGMLAASATPLKNVRIDPVDGETPQWSPDDGSTWLDIIGDPDAPPIVTPPAPVYGPDPAAQACLGSRRAALVLAEFYRATYGVFTAGMANTLNDMNVFLQQVNNALFSFIYPQAAQVVKALGLMESYDEGEYTVPELDPETVDLLTCLLLDNSSVPFDGIVQFDFEQVQTDMIATVGLNPGLALQSLLTYITSSGLNAASGTAVLDTYECYECLEWCIEFDFTTTSYSTLFNTFNPSYFTWVSGQGWRMNGDFRQFGYNYGEVITASQISMEWSAAGQFTGPPGVGTSSNSTNPTLNKDPAFAEDSSYWTCFQFAGVYIRKYRLTGIGLPPSVGVVC